MKTLFNIVMWSLHFIAKITHLTYNEINVILYYWLIPLLWAILLDNYIKLPLFSIIICGIWVMILIVQRKRFSFFCDHLFNTSVSFLLYFRKIGWSYTISSVIICVVIPLLITMGLILLNIF